MTTQKEHNYVVTEAECRELYFIVNYDIDEKWLHIDHI